MLGKIRTSKLNNYATADKRWHNLGLWNYPSQILLSKPTPVINLGTGQHQVIIIIDLLPGKLEKKIADSFPAIDAFTGFLRKDL